MTRDSRRAARPGSVADLSHCYLGTWVPPGGSSVISGTKSFPTEWKYPRIGEMRAQGFVGGGGCTQQGVETSLCLGVTSVPPDGQHSWAPKELGLIPGWIQESRKMAIPQG